MNAVQRYRQRRIKRLEERFGEYHGPLRRFDADDDSEANNNGGNSSGHGNTKIPYGLCQREGIQIGKDWTPKDAWDALEGKGYSAGSVYKELKKTGKVPTKASKEPEKPKTMTPEVKKLSKDVSALQKGVKKRERLEKKKAGSEAELHKATESKGYEERALKRCEEKVQEYLDKYGSEDKIPAKSEGGYFSPYTEYSFTKDRIKDHKREIEKYEAEVAEQEKNIKDLDDQMSQLPKREDYDKATKELLEKSPYTDNVRKCRGIEDDIRDDRRELEKYESEAQDCRNRIEIYEKSADKAKEKGEGSFVLEFYNTAIERNKEKLREYEPKISGLKTKVEDAENRMAEAKGDASDKDWKQIYDLSAEQDTVQDGPYDMMKGYISNLRTLGVKYLNPHKYVNTPDENQIINRLRGGDETRGSCVSLAMAYIANRAGYDVLDFRGGKSQDFFSTRGRDIWKTLGGKEEKSANDVEASMKLLATMENGKEYVLSTGRHASVVRNNWGKWEYLELQSNKTNGWKALDESALERRFSCTKSRRYATGSTIIESSKAVGNSEFISILGYINTGYKAQKKGESGDVK